MQNLLNYFRPSTIRAQTVPSAGRARRVDVDEEDYTILKAVRSFTMTSDERLIAVIDATRHLSSHNIQGAVVECGVWRGGSAMAVALTLLSLADAQREMYLFDTFEGMSAPTEKDRSHDGMSATEQLNAAKFGTGIWCKASLEDVCANMESTHYPRALVHYIPGKVEDTIPAEAPESIALLRLDTDWYESTRHELEHLYPRLVSGGILIIDDYGHWQGARQATNEYLATLETPPFLNRIDYTGRIAVKP